MIEFPISCVQTSPVVAQAALRHWLLGQAAPLWLEHGLDRARGGYFDQLDPIDASNSCNYKRLRVTCRQVFVFATLDEMGVGGSREAMDHGLAFLFGQLRHGDGGFVRTVDLDGRVLDERRDLYDLAFVIFALSSAYQRSGDSFYAGEAHRLLTFLYEAMLHPRGGFVESLPPSLPRRQNPHMHLLEACLAWLPISDQPAYRDTIGDILDLFGHHFWSENDGCLFEYFEDDWAHSLNPTQRIFEPGHHFEWIWLLEQCRASGLAVPDRLESLRKTVLALGFSDQSGLPYAEVHPNGLVADANCRLWSVTEWLRVSTTALSPDLDRPLAQFWRFLDARRPGFWAERWDANAQQFPQENVLASSFYHILTGILPLIKGCGTF
ncbi:AGE family epimerase/isomerase [Silvimonas sp.]|uniref:AGE family epimerase/isomerase n=1 Tax=Silvimonas sp. TaxID=2650811 RepID=UPI00284C744C|nr:AGE family epimerase/isomerase [Silvimonas sp.]MDR3429573.1 AGE family epimerase/isomerase [Silvimonas sp.]